MKQIAVPVQGFNLDGFLSVLWDIYAQGVASDTTGGLEEWGPSFYINQVPDLDRPVKSFHCKALDDLKSAVMAGKRLYLSALFLDYPEDGDSGENERITIDDELKAYGYVINVDSGLVTINTATQRLGTCPGVAIVEICEDCGSIENQLQEFVSEFTA